MISEFQFHLNIRVPEEVREKVEAISKMTGRSLSDVSRRIPIWALERTELPK